MSEGRRFSIYLTDDEVAIADATATRLGISRSAVIRHLVIYQGLTGGDFPLTSKILALPPADRDRVIAEIRKKSESNDPPKPQAFKAWVTEILGRADQQTMERSGDALLRDLLSTDQTTLR